MYNSNLNTGRQEALQIAYQQFMSQLGKLKLRFPVVEIAQKTGYSRGNVSDYINGKKPVSKKFLEKFYSEFAIPDAPDTSDLNSKPVEKNVVEEASIPYHRQRFEKKVAAGKKLTPFYDAPATASDVDGDMIPVQSATGYIDTGELFGNCQAAIRIRGNSMLQGYPSGTILGLNIDEDGFIEPGELYVIETRSKRVFKRIFYHDTDPDVLICYSDNQLAFSDGQRKGLPAYPSFPIHKNQLVRVWRVVGSARQHSNSMLLYRKPLKETNNEEDITTI